MKISATQDIKVEISDHEQKRITLETLCRHFHWNADNHFVKDGNVVSIVDQQYGSHSSLETTVLRAAMPFDVTMAHMVRVLKGHAVHTTGGDAF